MSEHPYARYVRTLGRGKRARRSLEREEAREVFQGLLEDRLTQAQTGALLMLLRVKEETPEELAGFIEAGRTHIRAHWGELPAVDLDWPSYSGKKKHHPWYLLAARVLADNGVRILMHGGPPHTPHRVYTEELLDRAAIPSAATPEEAAAAVADEGIVYVPLQRLSPALSAALMLRGELGLRSPVNSVVRGLNPAAAPLSVQTIFHPAYLKLHQRAGQLLGDPRLLLFKGEGGEVEIRPDARTRGMTGTPERCMDWVWPSVLERHPPPGTPDGEALRRLWHEDDDEYGRQAVVQTLAVLLRGLGRESTDEAARERAARLWNERDRQRL